MCDSEINCTQSADLGKIIFSDSTKSLFLPLEKEKKVYYKDSIGKELFLSMKFDSATLSYTKTFSSTEDCPSGFFTVKTEDKYISYKSDILDIEVRFFARMELTGPQNTREYREILRCYLFNSNNIVGNSLFEDIIFENTRNITPTLLKHTNVTLLGKEYKDVIIDKKITPTKCYLDKQVGIRAFRDFDGKLWVFDRFE